MPTAVEPDLEPEPYPERTSGLACKDSVRILGVRRPRRRRLV